MPAEINGQTFYDPAETAKQLGISRVMLRYYRGEEKIEGTLIGNAWFHTAEQIEAGRKAIAEKGKPGRKARKKDSDNDPSICV